MPKKKRKRTGEMLTESLSGTEKLKNYKAGNKEEKSPADEVFETLKEKINNISELTQLNKTIESVNKLENGGREDNQNQVQTINVLKQLKDAGLPLDNIMNLNQEQTQKLNNMLDQERKARLESEEKAIEAKKEVENSQTELVMKLMEMQEKRQEKELDNFKELISDLKQEVKNNNSSEKQKQKEDPVKKKAYEVLLDKFDEEMNKENPDPFESIAYNQQRLEQIKELLGAKNDNGLSDIDKKQMNLEHQLEIKKIEMEDKRRREELKQQKELEQQKLSKWDSLMNTLQQIAPAVINQISNGEDNNPAATQDINNFICEDCGQQMAGRLKEPPAVCPNCGSDKIEVV
jgi:DNA-binding transcriptional MerR regulator